MCPTFIQVVIPEFTVIGCWGVSSITELWLIISLSNCVKLQISPCPLQLSVQINKLLL